MFHPGAVSLRDGQPTRQRARAPRRDSVSRRSLPSTPAPAWPVCVPPARPHARVRHGPHVCPRRGLRVVGAPAPPGPARPPRRAAPTPPSLVPRRATPPRARPAEPRPRARPAEPRPSPRPAAPGEPPRPRPSESAPRPAPGRPGEPAPPSRRPPASRPRARPRLGPGRVVPCRPGPGPGRPRPGPGCAAPAVSPPRPCFAPPVRRARPPAPACLARVVTAPARPRARLARGPDVRTASSWRVRAALHACSRSAQCLGTARRAFVYPPFIFYAC
jgi:hypothetical protein